MSSDLKSPTNSELPSSPELEFLMEDLEIFGTDQPGIPPPPTNTPYPRLRGNLEFLITFQLGHCPFIASSLSHTTCVQTNRNCWFLIVYKCSYCTEAYTNTDSHRFLCPFYWFCAGLGLSIGQCECAINIVTMYSAFILQFQGFVGAIVM